MLNLPNVTLFMLNTDNPEAALRTLIHTMSLLNCGEVVFMTNKDMIVPEGIKFIKTTINNYKDYNKFIIEGLTSVINTDFVYIVHTDGYPINIDKWDNRFLDYDYIGAPFPLEWREFQGHSFNGIRVGNGVGIRSKKFIELSSKLKASPGMINEDFFLCIMNNSYFKDNGCKFAPVELAAQFSLDPHCSDYPRTHQDVFMVHGKYPQTKYIYERFLT